MPRRGDDGAAGARKACRRPRRTNPRKDLRHDHPEARRRPAMTDVSVRGLSKRYGGGGAGGGPALSTPPRGGGGGFSAPPPGQNPTPRGPLRPVPPPPRGGPLRGGGL